MDIKTTCPLGSECEQIKNDQLHRCRWYVHLQGKDPQSEKMIDQWDCAIAWLPMLLVENAQTNRGQTSALESLRNEVINIPQAKTIQAIAKGFTGLYLIAEENKRKGGGN